MKNSLLVFLSLIFLFSCKRNSEVDSVVGKDNEIQFEYIKELSIKEDSVSYTFVYNNSNNKEIIIQKENLPLQNMAIFSSSSLAYLEAIEALENIQGAYDAEWVYSENIQNYIQKGKIKDFGAMATANIEQLLTNPPDAILTYTTSSNAKLLRQATDFDIPVIYIDEFNEKDALAKAEYIKIFGLLTGKQKVANKLFNSIKVEYNNLRKLADSQTEKPTVMMEIMRGDIWYMPSGNSFPAQLVNDASGDYIWGDSALNSTQELNFEQVLSKAQNADFWLNASDVKTTEELYNIFNGHKLFKAAKDGNVYAYNKRKNSKGANDYFEAGTVHPELILKDLIYILHPELLPNHQLYFYNRLTENE